MKTILLLILFPTILALPARAQLQTAAANPAIDFQAFRATADRVGKLREERRITADQFLKMAKDENTIVLDTRSRRNFEAIHVRGARHLDISEATRDSLAEVVPDPRTRILIYCNNNFANAGPAMMSKTAGAALNLYTFHTLLAYGYENLYELGPMLDLQHSGIPFEGTSVPR